MTGIGEGAKKPMATKKTHAIVTAESATAGRFINIFHIYLSESVSVSNLCHDFLSLSLSLSLISPNPWRSESPGRWFDGRLWQ